MTRRPLAALGVLTLATPLLAATVVAAPVAVAAPGDPDQVALVVDYPDGSTRSFCVDHRSGMSGADVLAVAGPTYGTGPYQGFVLRIGGQGTVPPTTSRYWAYWVTQGGGLVYSGAGVTSTRPAAGSVEAWHWNSSDAQERPSGGSYASLCPGGFAAAPAPATTPGPASSGVAAPSGPGGGAGGSGAGGSGSAGSASGGSTSGGTTATASGSATAPAGSGAPSSEPSGTPTSGAATTGTGGSSPSAPTTSVAASAVAATEDAEGSGTGAVLTLVVVSVAAAGLAALAVVARRRRAEQD